MISPKVIRLLRESALRFKSKKPTARTVGIVQMIAAKTNDRKRNNQGSIITHE